MRVSVMPARSRAKAGPLASSVELCTEVTGSYYRFLASPWVQSQLSAHLPSESRWQLCIKPACEKLSLPLQLPTRKLVWT